ncbi:MAG: RNB domain-containing ribonuclease, partial [Oscillospiraceae bacterium]|nr:RNB domain-containing ribonuclease [Oscillospiraceae bacterium]
MKKVLAGKIIKALYKAEKPLNVAELMKAVNAKKASELKPALNDLSRKGIITQGKTGWKPSGSGFFKGEVLRVFRAHGFIKDAASEEEYFVPGRRLLGGVPGDLVLARVTEKDRGEGLNSAAEVLLITEESKSTLTGTIVSEYGGLCILPDSFSGEPVAVHGYGGFKPREGDKVGFVLNKRGERHSEHTADITAVYGNGAKARVCVNAYIDEKNIPCEFSKEAKDEAKRLAGGGVPESEMASRLDLREEIIFTIDGADTKDIDDAIGIEKTKNGYKLGVHIADVS